MIPLFLRNNAIKEIKFEFEIRSGVKERMEKDIKPKHLAASVAIRHEKKILLVFHNKLKTWLFPGGHVESWESPDETALREVYEETGLNIRLINRSTLLTSTNSVRSVAQPICILEEMIYENGNHTHYHIDFIYEALLINHKNDDLLLNKDEVSSFRWVNYSEIGKIENLLPDVKEILKMLLDEKKDISY